jgi:hypothetical protein
MECGTNTKSMNRRTTNLRKLHLAIKKEQAQHADMDSDAHAHTDAHDLVIHPPILQGPIGYIQWQWSDMARLLKLDIDDDKNKSVKPSDLCNTKDECTLFPLTVFRKHIIGQEVCSGKYSIY